MDALIDDDVMEFLQRLNVSCSVRIGNVSSTIGSTPTIWPAGVSTLMSAADAMGIAGGVKGGHGPRLAKYMACINNHGIVNVPVLCTWKKGRLEKVKSCVQVVPMASFIDIRRLACYILRRGLKAQSEIDRIRTVFGIPESMFESAFVAMPEKDTLGSIARAIPYPCDQQFRVGQYRIDLYFPDIRLAVSCAEYRHVDYNVRDDLKRKRFITSQLSCQFVEFDPYCSNFSVLYVIRDIVEKLVCPEFQQWNQQATKGPWRRSMDRSHESLDDPLERAQKLGDVALIRELLILPEYQYLNTPEKREQENFHSLGVLLND
jgi:hypothetical protein